METQTATAPTAPKRKRVHTPTVLQMEAVECGAASLAMVLGYFGRTVPLEEVRVACGVSRDGSNASSIMEAAQGFGLEASFHIDELDDLVGRSLPLIVHWEFHHFVVVEGWDAAHVYLNDPAAGLTRLTWEAFSNGFTGVALEFELTDAFQRGGVGKRPLRALAERLRGSATSLGYCVLAGLALVVPGLAIPVFSKVFVDQYLTARNESWAIPLIVGLLVASLAQMSFTWLQQVALLRLETKLAITSSSRFIWHVLRLPLEFYSQRFSGEIAHRVSLNDRVASLLSGQLATTILSLLTIVFYLVVMVTYDWFLTLVAVSIAAVNLIALRAVSGIRATFNKQLLQEQGKAMGLAMAGLTMIETLKATGTESDLFARWAGYMAKVGNARQSLGIPTQLLGAVPPLLLAISNVAILSVGGYRVMVGSISLGTLVAFQALMVAFLLPINNIVALGSSLQEVEGSLERLDDVLHNPVEAGAGDREPARVTERAAEAPPKLSGHLELRGVTFGYNRLAPPLIEGFDLVVRPGQRVALVGGTGSGKSTLSRLVTGLYAPWSGEILFDGIARDQIPRRQLAESLALVDQDVFLFEGTVRDNLTLWDPTIPDARIVQAARDASIHFEIAVRLGSYDSAVLEGGRNFSGGQRQRLEIARALTRDPSILVLDEATSALDPTTEQRVDQALRRRGCTCLIIAHRLSTIRDCDEIIVLNKGKVAQRGTHDDLKRELGLYAELVSA